MRDEPQKIKVIWCRPYIATHADFYFLPRQSTSVLPPSCPPSLKSRILTLWWRWPAARARDQFGSMSTPLWWPPKPPLKLPIVQQQPINILGQEFLLLPGRVGDHYIRAGNNIRGIPWVCWPRDIRQKQATWALAVNSVAVLEMLHDKSSTITQFEEAACCLLVWHFSYEYRRPPPLPIFSNVSIPPPKPISTPPCAFQPAAICVQLGSPLDRTSRVRYRAIIPPNRSRKGRRGNPGEHRETEGHLTRLRATTIRWYRLRPRRSVSSARQWSGIAWELTIIARRPELLGTIGWFLGESIVARLLYTIC